jgi:rhamnosyltransferase subunit B
LNVLVISFGGGGDIHPMAALSRALFERGHRVCFVSNPYFEPLARKLGLDFAGYGSAERLAGYMQGVNPESRNRRLIHALTGASWVEQGFARWHVRKRVIAESMRGVYSLIEQRYVPGETVVVAHTNAFGARIAQEKLGVPLVTVHLQPAVLRSRHDAPGLPLPDGDNPILRGLRSLLWASIDLCADRIVTPEVNAFRAELGLPPVRRPFAGWVHSPALVLGLFPDWFAPPQPDWPPNTHLSGFPLFDEGSVREMPAEVESYLAAGTPPVVFTVGSFARRSRRFFEVSVEACKMMERRGLLLAPSRDLVPEGLPETLRYFDYVPLSALLPRAAAIVHHGGIGTAGLALAAGIPQLVVPFADDQSDNAARVQRLHAGLVLTRGDYRPRGVARKLGLLLGSKETALACRSAAERIRQRRPLSETCRLIEQLTVAPRIG